MKVTKDIKTLHNVHLISSGGGLDKSDKWKKSKDKFFLPVKALLTEFLENKDIQIT